MIALLKTWLSSNILRLFGYGAAALSVFSVLLGARQSGRKVEQLNQLKKKLEIKDAQLRATLTAPRNRTELINQLRDGKF